MKKTTVISLDPYNLMVIAGLCAIGYAFWFVRDFLLMLLVALVISTFIEDFVKRGEKHKLPRVLSVIIFYTFSMLVFFGILIFLVPVIINEVGALSNVYPEITKFINLDILSFNFDTSSNIRDMFVQIQETPIEKLFASLGSLFGGIFNMVIVFVISFYLSMQDHGLDRVFRIFTPKKHEASIRRIWENTQKKIGGWFRGQLIIAALLFVITYIGLSVISVPYALLLSLLAGLFGLVPYGIFIAVLPAIGLGFIYGGMWKALTVASFYIIIQQLLDYVVQPLVLKKIVGIPSLVVILSMILGVKLFGIAGLIIAIPLALFSLEIIAEIEKHKQIQNPTE